MMREQRTRSLAKAITYRVVSSNITGTTFFAFAQKGSVALVVVVVDSLVKTSVFYLHERTWIFFGAYCRGRTRAEAETVEAA